MFVSSYSTYIDTTATKRINNERKELEKKPSDSFSSKLLSSKPETLSNKPQLPLNYVSNYKSLYNRQRLDQQDLTQTVSKMKFSKISSLSSAQIAYTANSKMFSLIAKPKIALDQTPSIDKKLPKEAQVEKESLLKINMVNAYIANDNYYQITAA